MNYRRQISIIVTTRNHQNVLRANIGRTTGSFRNLSFFLHRLHRLLKLPQLFLKLRLVTVEFDGFLLGGNGFVEFAGLELGGGEPVENRGVGSPAQLGRLDKVLERIDVLPFQAHAAADVEPSRFLGAESNGPLGVLSRLAQTTLLERPKASQGQRE